MRNLILAIAITLAIASTAASVMAYKSIDALKSKVQEMDLMLDATSKACVLQGKILKENGITSKTVIRKDSDALFNDLDKALK